MSSTISLFVNISRQVTFYMNIPILVVGVIGGTLNLIVFLSLKTFRQNSCSFYLMFMSWFNIGQLLTGNLSRIMNLGYGIDWTQNSLLYCKIRWYFIQICTLTSYACLCFATIDQYLATSPRYRLNQWVNIKAAYCLCSVALLFSVVHGIPSIVYFNHVYSNPEMQPLCLVTNSIYQQYRTYGYFLVLAGFLPLIITVIFGLLAFKNVQELAYREVPIVRRELDKQLTCIVLVQIFYSFIVIMPYNIYITIATILNLNDDPIVAAKIQILETLSVAIYYSYFAVSLINLTTSSV